MDTIRRHPLPVVIAAYLVLGIVYSTLVPVFEAPDEQQHYGYVHHLAAERRLPSRGEGSIAEHEASQPPLYYTAAALATALGEQTPVPDLRRNRFYASYQAPGTVNDNKNVFLHDDREGFPWREGVLAVHIARFINLLFGALTVSATYLLAGEIFGEQTPLALSAAAVVAFTPQFLFISSAVNNDIAASALSTATLWLLVGGLREGYAPKRMVLLGIANGLAALSKVSALALLPLTLSVMGLQAWVDGRWSRRTRRLRRLLTRLGGVLVLALAVGGWWYIRNALLYQDPLGFQTHFETWWRYEDPLPLSRLLNQLPGVALSFWAAFGMGNVHLPMAYYAFAGTVSALAVIGLLIWFVRSWLSHKQPGSRAWSLALMAAWLAVVSGALLRWMQLVKAALGRLLFPAIGAIAILAVWGLTQLLSWVLQWASATPLLRQRIVRSTLLALVSVLFCASAAAPFVAIRPAYARPTLLSPQEIAARTIGAGIEFGDITRLRGYRLDQRSVHPGGELQMTLCWEALRRTETEYALFVHLLGAGERIVGARDTYPGLGRFPTSDWTSGDAFCDVIRVPVQEDAPTQAAYHVEIGWYDPETGRRLRARGPDGNPMDLVLLDRVSVVSKQAAKVTIQHPVDANLGDRVTLIGYRLSEPQVRPSESLTVTLYWQAQTTVADDYTVFVHLAAGDTAPHAQADGQPRDGRYPTSLWQAGEVVVDRHTLRIPADLPSGEYELLAGMYVLETGDRLRWRAPDGSVQGNRVPLQTVAVRSESPSVDE